MSSIAIILIIISAVMHAFWNFISKRRVASIAFFFIASTSAAVLLSPLLIVYRATLAQFPKTVWRLVSATGFFQMLYFLGLAGAYKRGDISLAYPLVRAFPVLFVAAISLIFGNRVNIDTISLMGMGLIIIGCIILPLPHFRNIRLGSYFDSVYLMALIAALGTTGYTLVDDQALDQLRDTAALQLSTNQITILFIALQTTSTALVLGLVTIFFPPRTQSVVGTITKPNSLNDQYGNRYCHYGDLRPWWQQENGWVKTFMTDRRERIEAGIPFVNIDMG